MKRSYSGVPDSEPEQVKFELPSEGEHLLQVADIFTCNDDIGAKMNLDDDVVAIKFEVAVGPETGRSLLHRLNLDQSGKGFFAVRLFLKALGENYKGDIDFDTDDWQGRQVYATVVHNTGNNGKTYANIGEYIFEKCKEVASANPGGVTDPSQVKWDE